MASLGSNAIVKIGKQTYSCRHSDMILALEDEVRNLNYEEMEEKGEDENKAILRSEDEENPMQRIVETHSSLSNLELSKENVKAHDRYDKHNQNSVSESQDDTHNPSPITESWHTNESISSQEKGQEDTHNSTGSSS